MNLSRRREICAALTAMLLLAAHGSAVGQFGGPPGPTGPARDVAPIDLTGQWVSIVTEDWRFRMVTPPKGDFPGLQITPAARAIADAWDPAKDEAEGNECKSYGAAAIMRVPGRIRISWRDDSTLELQTDAGRQTRVFHFGDVLEPEGEPSWQGVSKAQWLRHRGPPGSPPNGSLKVVTTGMKAGYLRRNGLPYSANAVVTEYFDILHHPDQSQWLVVKTIVEDPEFLTSEFITSSNFRKQNDRSGWDPTPCSAR